VAAAVGGLRTAVADGVSGRLVEGHDARRWARVLGALIADPVERDRLAAGALVHAKAFGWPSTAAAVLEVYLEAMAHAGSRAGDAAEAFPVAR
jgi:D-inositol-3-phosphate glycosyltransferase